MNAVVHIILIYILWLRIQVDYSYQRDSEVFASPAFPCSPLLLKSLTEERGGEVGVLAGATLPAQWSSAASSPARGNSRCLGAKLNKTSCLVLSWVVAVWSQAESAFELWKTMYLYSAVEIIVLLDWESESLDGNLRMGLRLPPSLSLSPAFL